MSYAMTLEDPIKVTGMMLKMIHDHGNETLGGANFNWWEFHDICVSGRCKLFILWKDGKMVGYSFWIVSKDLMQSHKLRADEAAIFVYPEHRGRPAIRFIKFCEMKLRDAGYDKIVRYGILRTGLDRVLEKLGYERTEVMMVKEFK